MSSFVILEESAETRYYEGDLPDPHTLPAYTYGYEVEAKEWYRVHQASSPRAGSRKNWVLIDPADKTEGVPKNIRAAVLILGG
jgi:hypothetical protein